MAQGTARRSNALVIALFLGSAVAANLAVNAWGQPALVFTAWVLIPFDLITRDILHDRWKWRGSALWRRMALLILAGALLTCVASWNAREVALASFAAFAAAGAINAIVFHRNLHRSRYFRMNISNLAAASVDSVVFPLVAFGVAGTSGELCVAQAASKFIGGLLWSAAFLYIANRNKS
tara:strand:- start:133 stop:669 length:537 start_codon:yes stop_codon:yes gene_type:complete